ncbi:MAG: Fe-S cluster assembly protein IscX [Proteobacteria bacterium]|nr:Fe-S cluster assembly protein IscX [Pseudomonadota bacterium]
MRWTDVRKIAEELEISHPGVDVVHIRFTDLWQMVCNLDGFVDDPKKCNEKILEAIQACWLEEKE